VKSQATSRRKHSPYIHTIKNPYSDFFFCKNEKKPSHQEKKRQKTNRHFKKEDSQVTKNHMKWYSTSVSSTKMQIKIMKEAHYTASRMSLNKNYDH
jgi:hypothetical protein